MEHTSTNLPHFLTVAQAAAISHHTTVEIQHAIDTMDLPAVDPTGKGLRISRDAFVGWMSGNHLPPWEGKASDWVDFPKNLLLGDITFARHPEEKHDAWVSVVDIVRIRAHVVREELEITFSNARDAFADGCPIVEFDWTLGEHEAGAVWKLGAVHKNRRIIHSHGDFGPTEAIPNPLGAIYARTYHKIPWPEFIAFLRGVSDSTDPKTLAVIKTLPSKVLGTEVALALGIVDPNPGDYRKIAEVMRGQGWKSKRTNKGACYFAPTIVGNVQFHFGGE